MSSFPSRPSQSYYPRGPPTGITSTDCTSTTGDSNLGPPGSLQSTVRTGSRRSRSRTSGSSTSGAADMAPTDGRPPLTLGQLNPEQKELVYREALNSELSFLCRVLDVSRHFPYLKSKRVFDGDTQERINHRITTREKVDTFIGEILRTGLNGMVAFFESLERERVERHILTRLLATCQTTASRLYQENAFTGDTNDHNPHQREADVDDRCASGPQRSYEPGTEGEVLYDLDGGIEDAHPPIPRLDVNCLRKAQGIIDPDSTREGEEDSDLSSTYELTTHGY